MNKPGKLSLCLMIGMLSMLPIAFGAYQVGDNVDDFTLFDSTGREVNLYDYTGLTILLDFWTST